MFIINDFGYTTYDSCPAEDKLTVAYRSVACYSIYFPYLSFLAKRAGATVWHTRYDQGQTQLFMIAKGRIPCDWHACLDTLFKESGYARIQASVEKILSFKEDSSLNLQQTQEIFQSFSADEQSDYLLCLTCMASCLDDGLPHAAIDFFRHIPQTYSAVGCPTYQLLGKAYKQLKEYARSAYYFTLALSISKDFLIAHRELAMLALEQNDYPAYLEHATAFVQASMEWEIWEMVFTIAVVQTKTNRLDEARALCRWLCETHAQHPTIVRESIANKSRTLLTSFLKESDGKG